jgi:hypothetical protein
VRSHDRAVHPVGDWVGELDLDIDETDATQALAILGDRQGAGDASDVAPTRCTILV